MTPDEYLEISAKLSEIMSTLEELETVLEEVLSNSEAMSALSGELGIGQDEANDEGDK